MADVIKAKDDAELEVKHLYSQLAKFEAELQKERARCDQLEAQLLSKEAASLSVSASVSAEEVTQLKETIRLLELERSSTRNVCQKAIQVLDSKESEQMLREIEKLKAREQHFREASEIFQQKLQVLTEENRRLRGVKQSYWKEVNSLPYCQS